MQHDISIADVADRYPPMDRRVVTTLALLPEDHRALAQLALDLGLDRAGVVRRALVLAHVLPPLAREEVP